MGAARAVCPKVGGPRLWNLSFDSAAPTDLAEGPYSLRPSRWSAWGRVQHGIPSRAQIAGSFFSAPLAGAPENVIPS